MSQEYGDPFAVIAVDGAVPLVTTIKTMRREIGRSCTVISSRARRLSLTNRKVELSLGRWEGQLNNIMASSLVTHSLDELEVLRKQCEEISVDLAQMSKK